MVSIIERPCRFPRNRVAKGRRRDVESKPANFPMTQQNGESLKNIPQALLDRRATTHFRSNGVPELYLDAILKLALQAPSGYNLQPWRFIVVQDEQNRKKLQRAAWNQEKIAEAPVIVIAVGLEENWEKRQPTHCAKECSAVLGKLR